LIPEHIIYASSCASHLNRTRFSYNKTQTAMYCRSGGCSQERIRSNRDLDVVYDVTGDTGWILGVPNLQPRCGTPTSALQGSSGTFK